MKRNVKSISIFPSQGRVGIVFEYESGPADPFLLPLKVALQFKDKLIGACNEVAKNGGAPGDSVGVQDFVSMHITPPRSN